MDYGCAFGACCVLEQLNHAVPPFERLEPWYTLVETSEDRIEQRRGLLTSVLQEEWMAIYSNSRMFCDGRINADHPDLPDWVRHAEGVCYSAALPQARDLSDNPRMQEALYLISPVTQYAHSLLHTTLPQTTFTIEEKAIIDILAGLGRRLMFMCSAILDEEIATLFNVAHTMGIEGPIQITVDATTYPDLYKRYPVFAYVVGNTIAQWHTAVIELITRLQHDSDDISTHVFNGMHIDRLVSVSMDTGDLHDHGRSVALLTFNNDLRIAYKPKDLRIVERVQALFSAINDYAGKPLLHTRSVLVRLGYAWEEFVHALVCTSQEEVHQYYWRYGAMIRMYELLEARDLWLDNVVASGAWPAVIDLEMVLQPRLHPEYSVRPSELLAHDMVQETCQLIGLVSMQFPIAPGEPHEDMGGLTVRRDFRTPFKKMGLTGAGEADSDQVALTNDIYTPRFNGCYVDSRMYYDDVQRGYEEFDAELPSGFYDIISAWATELDPTLPVRAIYRDTWTYLQALHASCSTSTAISVYHREAFLARFPASLQSSYAYDSVHARTTFAEIEQLRRQDVPYFITRIGNGELCTGNGTSLGTFYSGSALQRLIDRCANPVDAALRRAVLSAMLETCHGGNVHTTRIYVDDPLNVPDAINDIVNDILSWRISVGEDKSWLSLIQYPTSQSVVFETLRPMWMGTLQVAIALREAQLCTNRSDLTPVIDALRSSAEQLKGELTSHINHGTGLPWHYDEHAGLPGLVRGLNILSRLDTCEPIPFAAHMSSSNTTLRSTTRIPARLWLLGEHGTCSCLRQLCASLLNTPTEELLYS